MGKLYDLLSSGYGTEEDFNCAEKILYGTNKVYNLNLPKEALKLSAGFGGGMGVEDICGVITGAVMALSHLFVKEVAHESTLIKEKTSELIITFKEEMTSINCEKLKGLYRTEELKCSSIILKSAEILDRMISKEMK